MAAGYGMAKEVKEGKEYDWYHMLKQFKDFKDKYGRNPRSMISKRKETLEIEPRLYQWMCNTSRLILTGGISKEHLDAIIASGVELPNVGNILNGSKVSDEDQKWFVSFNEFKEDYRKGTLSFDTLYWGNTQIQRLRKGEATPWQEKKLLRIGIKPSTEFLTLTSVSTYRLTRSDDLKIWCDNAYRYLDFITTYGNPKSSGNRSDEELAMYYWRLREMAEMKKGNRTKVQVDILIQLNVIPPVFRKSLDTIPVKAIA